MKLFICSLSLLLAGTLHAAEPKTLRDVPYAEPKQKLQTLDVFAPGEGTGHPIVVWIHGGGWQGGDKGDVKEKPRAFVERGYVFVSANYRLWPQVTLDVMAGDIAKAIRWTHDHAEEFGGAPKRIIVMGHSAGAHLAALVCTDERYLQAEGLSLDLLQACVPIDGHAHDVPLQILWIASNRKESYEKMFGDEASQKNLSPVTHAVKGKAIPPFLLPYCGEQHETARQSLHLARALQTAGYAAREYAAGAKNYLELGDKLGTPNDPTTAVLFVFLGDVVSGGKEAKRYVPPEPISPAEAKAALLVLLRGWRDPRLPPNELEKIEMTIFEPGRYTWANVCQVDARDATYSFHLISALSINQFGGLLLYQDGKWTATRPLSSLHARLSRPLTLP